MDAIGRYRVVRQLGEGGMGVVYEAHDERLNRTVAVKLMRDMVDGPQAIERFWREARAAAIDHPHICQIYYAARGYARLNETEKAIAAFTRVVELGYFCYPAFARDPWLDPLRSDPRFVDALRTAEARHRAAARAFEDRGGPRLLGLPA